MGDIQKSSCSDYLEAMKKSNVKLKMFIDAVNTINEVVSSEKNFEAGKKKAPNQKNKSKTVKSTKKNSEGKKLMEPKKDKILKAVSSSGDVIYGIQDLKGRFHIRVKGDEFINGNEECDVMQCGGLGSKKKLKTKE